MVRVTQVVEARVLGEGDWIAVTEICQICRLDLESVLELAQLGIVSSREHAPGEWQVAATALPRLRVAGRLIQDLGVNVSGAALALELLEAQRELEKRLRRLERLERLGPNY
jgi:chaperone modulatory protein CbpM